MKARCPRSRSIRCQRSAVMRLPSRDPGGAGQISATRTAAQTRTDRMTAGKSSLPGVTPEPPAVGGAILCRTMDPLAADLRDARSRTLALVSDLDDAQWMGPRLAIVNPMLWEVGHVAWFQEFWTLRHARG